eukprot:752395-Prymnesium_polylepis.1
MLLHAWDHSHASCWRAEAAMSDARRRSAQTGRGAGGPAHTCALRSPERVAARDLHLIHLELSHTAGCMFNGV